MADKEVTIKVSADTAQAKANLSELGEKMKQLGKGGAGGDTTAPAGGITAEQADLLNKMQAQLVAYNAKVDELRAAYDRLANSTSGASSKSSESLKALEGEVEVLKKQQSALVDKVLELQVENNRLRDTHAGAGSGAQSQASAEDGLAQKMAYAAMNVRQLRQEIVSLNSARKDAAAAGDTQDYEELTAKVGAARTALRAATQARNVEKAAMMGQATAGMQLANQLNALAESAASGQVNVASMANQVISLGMAFKAGLGPIGWVMAALQGLQMVMQRVTEWDKKEAAAIAETEKMLKKKAEAMEALRLEEMKTANAIAKGQAEESARQAEAQGKAELERLKSENAAKQAERNRELQALRSSLKAETDLKKAAVLSGELSEDEFNAWQEGQNRKLAQAEKNNQLLANEERRAMVEKELAISQATLDEREKLYGKLSGKLDADQAALIAADDGSLKALLDRYDSLAKSQDERRTAIEELEEKLDNASHWYGDDADKEELEKQLDAAKDALRSVSSELVGVESELRLGFGKQMDLLQEVGISKEESLEANARILLSLKQELNETDKTRDQQIEKQRELQAQLSAIEEERKAIEQGVTERQREADAASTLRKAKEDKARAEEESKKRDAEAKKQEAEYNREIASELSRISGQYKVTGSYKEEDNRSAKQIRDCDRTILEAKERELRDLLARTSDAATREKIQAALDDTEKAQRALADATRKAADQEAKRLKNMAPPELHSKNKQVDRNLQSLGKSYARYAKAAEKAAEAGDAKAMEKAQKRMQYYAGRMGRASKDQEKADRMYKKDAEALEAVAEEHGKDYQHVKRAGQDKRREEAAEARRNRRANQEAARQQRTQQQAAQPQQQPQPQVNAQEVAAKSQAAMQELAAQVAALTGACNGVAAAAEGAAKAAKNAVKTLNQKLKSLNEEVNAIREEVDA